MHEISKKDQLFRFGWAALDRTERQRRRGAGAVKSVLACASGGPGRIGSREGCDFVEAEPPPNC